MYITCFRWCYLRGTEAVFRCVFAHIYYTSSVSFILVSFEKCYVSIACMATCIFHVLSDTFDTHLYLVSQHTVRYIFGFM